MRAEPATLALAAAASGQVSSARAAMPNDVGREAHCSSLPELSLYRVRLEQYKRKPLATSLSLTSGFTQTSW
eukprot:2492516-Pyramimonas_sp.AAC.1